MPPVTRGRTAYLARNNAYMHAAAKRRATKKKMKEITKDEAKDTILNMIKCVICLAYATEDTIMYNYCYGCSLENGMVMCRKCYDTNELLQSKHKQRCPTHNQHKWFGRNGHGPCYRINPDELRVNTKVLAHKARMLYGTPCANAHYGCKSRFLDDSEIMEHVCMHAKLCDKCNCGYSGSQRRHLQQVCKGYVCPAYDCDGIGARHVFHCDEVWRIKHFIPKPGYFTEKWIAQLHDKYDFLFLMLKAN